MKKLVVAVLLAMVVASVVPFPALAESAYSNARAIFAPGLPDYLPDASGKVTISYARGQSRWNLRGWVRGLMPDSTYYLGISGSGAISYVYTLHTNRAGRAKIKGVTTAVLPAYENVFITGPASSVPGETGAVLIASESCGDPAACGALRFRRVRRRE